MWPFLHNVATAAPRAGTNFGDVFWQLDLCGMDRVQLFEPGI